MLPCANCSGHNSTFSSKFASRHVFICSSLSYRFPDRQHVSTSLKYSHGVPNRIFQHRQFPSSVSISHSVHSVFRQLCAIENLHLSHASKDLIIQNRPFFTFLLPLVVQSVCPCTNLLFQCLLFRSSGLHGIGIYTRYTCKNRSQHQRQTVQPFRQYIRACLGNAPDDLLFLLPISNLAFFHVNSDQFSVDSNALDRQSKPLVDLFGE